MLAPVVIFAYNRPNHFQKTLSALIQCYLSTESTVIVFLDGPKKEKDIKKYSEIIEILEEVKKARIFKKFIFEISNINKGLATSVIEGVNKVVTKYGKVIVLEDDLVVSNDFLEFMNEALDYYQNNKIVGAISGYSTPINLFDYEQDVYLSGTGNSWGWATWKEVWEEVDWELKDYKLFKGNKKDRKEFSNRQYNIDKLLDMQIEKKINSWAVRWDYHFFKKNLYTVYPKYSKVQNIGFDEEGTHCNEADSKQFNVMVKEHEYHLENLLIYKEICRKTAMFYKPKWISLLSGIRKKILKIKRVIK